MLIVANIIRLQYSVSGIVSCFYLVLVVKMVMMVMTMMVVMAVVVMMTIMRATIVLMEERIVLRSYANVEFDIRPTLLCDICP